MILSLRATVSILLIASVLGSQAQAQTYPNKPIRFIVPYGAGGPGDAAARAVGAVMSKMWGQSFIIDNRTGGNEIVAAQLTTTSPGDGYTFMMAGEATASVNPYLYSKLPYDPKDLIPVSRMLTSPYVLAVRSDFPADSLTEFVAGVKRNPGKYTYGSQGVGGPNHLYMALFNKLTGTEMLNVPYRAITQGIQEVIAGRVDTMLAPVGLITPYVRTGKLKALAIGGSARQLELPDVATFAESGFRDFNPSFYLAVLAPRGTPSDITHRFARDMKQVMSDPEFIARNFKPQAYEPIGDTPEEFAQFLVRDREIAEQKVRASGAKLD